MNLQFLLVPFAALVSLSCTGNKPLYSTAGYSLYKDRIVQNEFEAKAISSTELMSNYKSPGFFQKSPLVSFKFCINGFDNEMPAGINHTILCLTGNVDSLVVPVIRFGEQGTNKYKIPENRWLPANIPVIFSVDMSDVFNAFDRQGYYLTSTGKKIFKEDFKGVYLAGNTPPLTWDFDNLPSNESLRMKETGHHIFELRVLLNPLDPAQLKDKRWKLSTDMAAFPQYTSDLVLENALYNLSLEEMCKAVETDSTWRTGKEWAGVWTRDISYSTILAMGHLQPAVSMKSLMRKVDSKGRIIQDTGTGGAWPVSSDRMIWAVAAYEIYLVTGDRKWLETIYPIIRRSVEDDLKTVYDEKTGLVRGESSFLDWREQEYPRWMQPADIYESENLGTCAVHYKAIATLAEMASLMGDKENAGKYKAVSATIKAGINRYLWQEDKGFYGQYRYGRNAMTLSPRSETLGEALCILFDIADQHRAEKVVSNVPSLTYGTPCFFPNIADIPPYHNDGIWPFVQSYWMWACAKAGNTQGVMHSIGAIYRAAALFLTNQENFVDYSGDWFGTQINSANMLWSLSGNLSIIDHLFFGLRFQPDGLAFEPFVPEPLSGNRSLSHFRYRKAFLDIELSGWGNHIESFSLDGKQVKPFIPGTIEGQHMINIVLSSGNLSSAAIKIVKNDYSPLTPVVLANGRKLTWERHNEESAYTILHDGKAWKQTTENQIRIPDEMEGEFQVVAVGKNGYESFASAPVTYYSQVRTLEVEDYATKAAKDYKDFSGTGFIEISTTVNPNVIIPVEVAETGTYAIDWRYANGNGPVNTSNKCAIRTLFIDETVAGIQVFPQRGTNLWNAWGWSNPVLCKLSKGTHTIKLAYMPYNDNMNLTVNQAMLDYLRLVKVH
ncbi:MAG: trehalase family glycosidase [Bacteroidota bacterium]|nr:trehalase family glycosidase [Bacteroidota bacterium]